MKQNNKMNMEWCLDADLLEFDHTGIANFHSPYDISVVENMVDRIAPIIWGAYSRNEIGHRADVLQALTPRIIVVIIYITQLHLTKKTYKKLGVLPRVTKSNFPNTLNYIEGSKLPDHSITAHGRLLDNKLSYWRWPFRMLLWKGQAIRRVPRLLCRDFSQVITAYSESTDNWLSEQDYRPVLWENSWYFSNIEELVVDKEAEKISKRVVEQILDELFIDSINLSQKDNDWLKRQCALLVSTATIHLERLIDKKNMIPTKLFSVATGSFWDRLMRIVVKGSGGKVYGFEHGCGLGFQSTAVNYYNEWFSCTEYVTISKSSKKMITDNKKYYRDLNIDMPELTSKKAKKIEQKNTRNAKEISGNENLLYVPFGTSGERARGGVLPPDITAVDFNARCVSFLRESGFNVTMKPHPAHCGPSANAYTKNLDIFCSEEPFEHVVEKVSAVITCDVRSTTTKYAIDNRIPLVVIDFGIPPLPESARSHICENGALADCSIEIDGKISINYENLLQSLQSVLDYR